MKAREFLVQKGRPFSQRDLVKQPLTVAELKRLGKLAGGPEQLVAPKQRKEAEGITGEALYEWLAGDGKRVRRPIIAVGGAVTLGFTGDVREKLEAEL